MGSFVQQCSDTEKEQMGAAKEKSHLKRCICGGKLSSCLKLVSTTGDHIINIKLGLIYHQGAFIHQIILKLDFDLIALDFEMFFFSFR